MIRVVRSLSDLLVLAERVLFFEIVRSSFVRLTLSLPWSSGVASRKLLFHRPLRWRQRALALSTCLWRGYWVGRVWVTVNGGVLVGRQGSDHLGLMGHSSDLPTPPFVLWKRRLVAF